MIYKIYFDNFATTVIRINTAAVLTIIMRGPTLAQCVEFDARTFEIT